MVSHQSKAFQKVLSRQRSPPTSLSWVRWPMEISFARHQFPADIHPSPLWSLTTLSRWVTPLVSACPARSARKPATAWEAPMSTQMSPRCFSLSIPHGCESASGLTPPFSDNSTSWRADRRSDPRPMTMHRPLSATSSERSKKLPKAPDDLKWLLDRADALAEDAQRDQQCRDRRGGAPTPLPKGLRPGGIRNASSNTSTARLERVLAPRIKLDGRPSLERSWPPRARATSKRQS
jgi:hypothetical protein